MEPEEKRRSTRVESQFRVELTIAGGGTFEGVMRDVSLTGLYIHCLWPDGFYVPVTIRLFLDGSSPPIAIESDGRVVRIGENGVGIEILHTQRESLIHLLRLLAFNLGDPGQIGKEVVRLGLASELQ